MKIQHEPRLKWIAKAIVVSIVAGGIVGGLVDAVSVSLLNTEFVIVEVTAGFAAALAVTAYGIIRFAGEDILEVYESDPWGED